MKTMSNSDAATYASLLVKNRAVANRFWAKCMGQDAAMDDETAEKLKGFLKSRLTAEDHEQVCNMLDGDVAQDPDAEPRGRLADDERAPRARYSDAASSKSFAERYPGLAHIRQL